MDSKDHETSGTPGESPTTRGRADFRGSEYTVSEYTESEYTESEYTESEYTEFQVHEHTTTVSQLGKDPECREALNRLYHYLDGELTESRRRQIKEHLDSCMPCLEAFDFEAELKLLIARRCRDEVPVHLRLRVIQALTEAGHEGMTGQGGSDDERTGTDSEGAGRPE
jgi:mycothiol system anti-sigma-R factor